MDWQTILIIWMWIVGIPASYKAIYKGEHSKGRLVFAHLWPVAFPVLFLIGLAMKSQNGS